MSILMILRIALKALARNKMRTALTMLGMIIGVAAVITMVALGTGAQTSIEAQIQAAGTNMIIVSAGNFMQGAVRTGQGNASTLVPDDAAAIARALINNPSILLADEPTGNLDTRTSIEVMGIFQRLNQERGISAVLITHESDIAEYGTRTVLFRDGLVVADRAVGRQRSAQDELAALPAAAEAV